MFNTQKGNIFLKAIEKRDFDYIFKREYLIDKSYANNVFPLPISVNFDFIPDLIDLGLNAIEPVQVRAKGMDFEGLVNKFSGRLVLQGSIDTQKTLPFGTTDDVKSEIKSRIDLFKDKGGFVLGPSQHLLSQVPLENILALYDTAWEHGRL